MISLSQKGPSTLLIVIYITYKFDVLIKKKTFTNNNLSKGKPNLCLEILRWFLIFWIKTNMCHPIIGSLYLGMK